jgi:hypothetical protein
MPPLWKAISRVWVAPSYPTERRLLDETGCRVIKRTFSFHKIPGFRSLVCPPRKIQSGGLVSKPPPPKRERYFFFPPPLDGRCVSALPAALLASFGVPVPLSVLAAAVAAFLLVTSLFFDIAITPFPNTRYSSFSFKLNELGGLYRRRNHPASQTYVQG